METKRSCICRVPGCVIPYGTCHCGCGERTGVAAQTRIAYGHVKGEPFQFIRGHAGRKQVHVLAEIDETMRTAVCAECGPTTIRILRRNAAGQVQWRCAGRIITEHSLSGISEEARTAFCRGCGKTVPITRNPARTKGWVCSEKLRTNQQAYREAHPEKIKDGHKAWRDANPGRVRDYQLKSLYGITLEQYQAEVARRSGQCDVCHEVPDGNGTNGQTLCVEHNHSTGEIRGYADRDCNTMIGGARDDPLRLALGIIYLNPTPEQLNESIRRLEWFRDVRNVIAASK